MNWSIASLSSPDQIRTTDHIRAIHMSLSHGCLFSARHQLLE